MNSYQQTGAALITSLLFLVILTLLGFSSSRSVIMQELISRNFSDQRLAMQAAEAALKYAEACIRNSDRNPSGTTISVATLCTGAAGANNVPLTAYDSTSLMNANTVFWTTRGTQYGTLTGVINAGAPALTLPTGATLSSQPRYVITLINAFRCLPRSTATQSCLYQVTAWATGVNPNTQKVVQSIFL